MIQKNKIQLLLLTILIVFSSCHRVSEGSKNASLLIKKTVSAVYETEPVNQNKNADAADDPAIWINFQNPCDSRIIGTDKKGGLGIYNLKGEKLNFYPDGNMNNVDIRYGFAIGSDTIDLACSSNRSLHSISVYAVQADGSLKNIAARTIVSEVQDDVYGFALYKSPVSQKVYAFVNSKAGEIEQWELYATNNKLVDARKVRAFQLETQVEGMVADDENQQIFIGEEIKGIWRFDAEPNGKNNGELVQKSTSSSNKNISYDIEGLTLYYLPNGEGYLIASSQGNYSYAVFERKPPHEYLGSFRIIDGAVDGVEETDGIDIYSYPLNNDFKHGMFVVQDGFNFDKKRAKAQNFKLVQWETIAELFDPPLSKN